MLLITRTALQLLSGVIKVGDWIALRLEREEDLHPFLREDYRPIQVAGRPRND